MNTEEVLNYDFNIGTVLIIGIACIMLGWWLQTIAGMLGLKR